MRYTIGLGNELAPLRFRLLPASKFTNLRFLDSRRRGTAAAVHCGFVKGAEAKLDRLGRAGLLRGGVHLAQLLSKAVAMTNNNREARAGRSVREQVQVSK